MIERGAGEGHNGPFCVKTRKIKGTKKKYFKSNFQTKKKLIVIKFSNQMFPVIGCQVFKSPM